VVGEVVGGGAAPEAAGDAIGAGEEGLGHANIVADCGGEEKAVTKILQLDLVCLQGFAENGIRFAWRAGGILGSGGIGARRRTE